MEVELQGKFNNKPFFDDVHRNMILKFPTDEGWEVFNNLLSHVSVAKDASDLGKELIMLCTLRWHQLCDLLMMVYNPKGYLWGGTLNMPGSLAAMPQ